MPNLKQGTLSFASAKRTNSIPNGKKPSITEKGQRKRIEVPVEVREDAKNSEALEISSDEEDAAIEIDVPAKRTRASLKKAQSSPGTTKYATPQSQRQKPSDVGIEREDLDVEDRARRYRKYYNEVKAKMEYMRPVHSEGQNKIHQMLRFFDMSYKYGPCIGMTRLERWERAEAFGLNPPVEVRDILLTKEGVEKAEYAECVLHGEV